MADVEREVHLYINKGTRVKPVLPGISAYRVEPVIDGEEHFVLARDDNLRPLSRPYTAIKWQTVPELVVDAESGTVEEKKRMVIGARFGNNALYDFIQPDRETGMFERCSTTGVHDFEYRPDLKTLVGQTGANTFVLDIKSCRPMSAGYHDLYRGLDGCIRGHSGTVDEPVKRVWPFNSDSE